MKLIEIRSTAGRSLGLRWPGRRAQSVSIPERVARMLAADRYLLRKFCATRFGMQLHEDIVPIAEALDQSLEVCDGA